MKKIYLLLFLLPLLQLKAQVPTCTLDPVFINSGREGIWPDSATNFVSGTVGQAYLQNVTVVIPYDTVVVISGANTTLHYSHVDLQTGSYGLPPGLSLAGTPSTLKFPGNDSSCMVIYGIPTTAGTYKLSFVLKVYTVESGNTFPVTTYTVGYYKITIAAAAGILSNKNTGFQLMQNSPNPLMGNSTRIPYTSPTAGKASLCVYNITGQKILEKEFTAQHGDNSYELDASALENGIYLYALELNGQKQIRRMVVAK